MRTPVYIRSICTAACEPYSDNVLHYMTSFYSWPLKLLRSF
jgi:hypothetical protein